MAKPLKLDVIGDATDGTRALDTAAAGLDRVADKADKAGDQLLGTAADAKILDEQLEANNRTLRELAVQFARTGDAADRMDLGKRIAKQQRELAKLNKVRALLPGDENDGHDLGEKVAKGFWNAMAAGTGTFVSKAGAGLSQALPGALGSAISAAGPEVEIAVGALIVTGIAATAPLIGATLSAAVLAGVGGAGIGAGIALALRDQNIKDAGAELGKHLSDQLSTAAESFVAPVMDSIKILREGFDFIAPDIKGIFDDLSPHVTDLARGVTGLVENVMPGLRKAAQAAGPILHIVAEELPRFGESISNFFKEVSEDADGAAIALNMVMRVLDTAITNTGRVVGFLERQFEDFNKIMIGVKILSGDASGGLGGLGMGYLVAAEGAKHAGEAADPAAQSFLGMANAMRKSTDEARTLADSLDKLADSEQQGRLSTLDFKDGLAELVDSVATNGRSLDDNSEKGRANLRVLESLISTADRAGDAARDQALAQGESADAAAAAGAKMRETFIADLEKAAEKAGLSKEKIDDMVAALKAADNKRIKIYIEYVEQLTRMFGKPHTQIPGTNGGTVSVGLSAGGRVGGGGPPGIDTQPRLLASDEWVATGKGTAALEAAFGRAGLDQLNRTGALPVGAAASGAAAAGGAAAGAAAAGGDLVLNLTLVAGETGESIAKKTYRYGKGSGMRTLEEVFMMAAS